MNGRHSARRESQFWEKVDTNGPLPEHQPELGPCWIWIAARLPKGYGQFRLWRDKGSAFAHRWAYEHFVGDVPEGLDLDHLCRRTSCVNPEHLEAVTHLENCRRWSESRTHCKRGHAYTPKSFNIRGERRCKVCDYELERARTTDETRARDAAEHRERRARRAAQREATDA